MDKPIQKNQGKKPFYITTTIPYVNAVPHVGNAMEMIRADVIARYKRLMGFEVFFNTGTDEHGIKVYQQAAKAKEDPQDFVDKLAPKFQSLKKPLNLSYDRFIRTTEDSHKKAAQEFWKRCNDAGYIYKKNYKGLYCVGCEVFVTEKDLVDGECPHHPGRKPEEIEEENYFFKYSEFKDKLLKFYESNPGFVMSEPRFNELKAMVKESTIDFSISRLKEKMPWGVEVPGDDEHVMYVWFDALVNYISTLGWPASAESGKPADNFEKFWVNGTPVQICGKDMPRFQAGYWQAMLMAVGLPNTHKILVNGFIISGGKKMSKTVGNVIDPLELVKEYGTDALRYFLLRETNQFEDADLTPERLKEAYNASLANGLGNLTARIMKMAEDNLSEPLAEARDDSVESGATAELPVEFVAIMDDFLLQDAANFIWKEIADMDEYIAREEPFKLIKTDPVSAKVMIEELVIRLYTVARMLQPFMPETSDTIKATIKDNKKPETLFDRK